MDHIVVEYANSLYQKVVDRYIAGEDVPIEEVEKAWRNTMAPGPVSPVYPSLYEAVRQSLLFLDYSIDRIAKPSGGSECWQLAVASINQERRRLGSNCRPGQRVRSGAQGRRPRSPSPGTSQGPAQQHAAHEGGV